MNCKKETRASGCALKLPALRRLDIYGRKRSDQEDQVIILLVAENRDLGKSMHWWIEATLYLLSSSACLFSFGNASSSFPTPTFAGLRDAQAVEVEVLPTSNPWSPSEILKRLNGDDAVCGWIDGAPSEL